MHFSGAGMRLEGDPSDGFLTVQKIFPNGPVALANEEALQDDPNADLVKEGDRLVSCGNDLICDLDEQAVRDILAQARDGDVVLEFARRFVRASGEELEHFSIVIQAGTGEEESVVNDIGGGIEVIDLSSKAAKKNARAKKEKEMLERRKAKSDEKNQTVSVHSSSYLKQLAEAPPVWEPPGGDFLSSLGAGAAGQTTAERLKQLEANSERKKS